MKNIFRLLLAGFISACVCTSVEAQNNTTTQHRQGGNTGNNNRPANQKQFNVDVNKPHAYRKPADARMNYRIVKNYPVKGTEKCFSALFNDKEHKLYLCRATEVEIFGAAKLDSIGSIKVKDVGGIAFFKQAHFGYITNTKEGTVSPVDPKTHKPGKPIKVGDGPVTILADDFSKCLFVCNEKGKSISVIDPKKNVVTNTIPLRGRPKALVSDEAGKIYVTIQDKNEVLRIDTKTRKVEKGFYIGDGKVPSALAIDVASKQLFLGCENRFLIVINTDSAKVVNELPIGNGCGSVVYDPMFRSILAAGADGRLTLMKEGDNGVVELINDIRTPPGARILVLDQETHRLFMPSTTKRGDKARVPGTSMEILMVAN